MAEKLYNEIKDVDVDIENPLEVLSKCKYLDNILKEVQRSHSIVGSVSRKATEEVTMLGRTFPKNTRFAVYIRGIHLSPRYYDEPDLFNPDRWDSPQSQNAFLPFGDGPHNCIGRKLAELEFKLILMQLVRNYKFELVPGHPIEFFTTVTHGLKDGLRVYVSKRE